MSLPYPVCHTRCAFFGCYVLVLASVAELPLMKFKARMRSVIWFLIINVVVLSLALFLASLGWAPYGEEELPAAGGDIFVRVLCVFPLFLLICLVNFIWAVWTAVRVGRDGLSRRRTEVIWLAIAIVAWSIALAYDHSRQYLG